MRIDLFNSGNRPLPFTIGLKLVRKYVNAYPGPPLAISYRMDLFDRSFIGYIVRAMKGSGGWDRGHAEMFAAFVSKLNSCVF